MTDFRSVIEWLLDSDPSIRWQVMRDLLAPYRKEDGDEVMEIIKANGGMEKISLAFYQEGKNSASEPWTYWRLEGPGFVWNFRPLPHVHCFVNVQQS